MSRSKDSLPVSRVPLGANAKRSKASRLAFVPVTPQSPCPVCGRKRFCSIGERGTLCTRVEEGSTLSGESSECGAWYFHPHDADTSQRYSRALSEAPPQSSVEAAPVDVRDRAYRALLSRLSLDRIDRDGLLARGLTEADVKANRYRSLPKLGRAEFARAIVDAVGEAAAASVPGVWWKVEDGRGWWSLGGDIGLVVPVRDVEGRIAALKVRRRDVDADEPRYRWITSAPHGGPKTPMVAHVPVAALALRGRVEPLVITEGELKADVATSLADLPVVSIPGVGAWSRGVELARVWGARSVAIALDMERPEKLRARVDVGRARLALLEELQREGFDVTAWRWSDENKGIDDHLKAMREHESET